MAGLFWFFFFLSLFQVSYVLGESGMGENKEKKKKGPKRRFIFKLRSKKEGVGCESRLDWAQTQQSVKKKKKFNWRRLLRARANRLGYMFCYYSIKVCCLWL